jgi:phthiocerol/phenolphthiocerol synthesis type-I polyketide synthase E
MHIRETVRFGGGVKVLLKEKKSIFIEVGPGPTLGTLAKKCMKENQKQKVVHLVRHPKKDVSDCSFLLNKAGWLWL